MIYKSSEVQLMVQKFCTSWDVVYPIIYKVLAPSQVVFSPDFWTINSISPFQVSFPKPRVDLWSSQRHRSWAWELKNSWLQHWAEDRTLFYGVKDSGFATKLCAWNLCFCAILEAHGIHVTGNISLLICPRNQTFRQIYQSQGPINSP